MCVKKRIRGKDCYFARGKHITFEKAQLIAGKVAELSETTDDKTEIMKGLIPFAKDHNIALCTLSKPRCADNTYIHNCGRVLYMRRSVGGNVCEFAGGKDLTFEKANLIAGKVAELS